MMTAAAPTPKAVALVLLPALVLMLTFSFSYVGAFHDPRPHAVPLAVVGPPAVAAQLNGLASDPLDARQASSRADALSQIDDREVYGAYDATANRLYVASAANRATAIALERTFDLIAAARRQPPPRVTVTGHVVAICAVADLTIFASAVATAGIQAAAGPAGTSLVILVFVILGNPASGGPFARPLLPGLWRTVGGVLPNGASVDLARATLFFDGSRIAGPILVLVGWTLFGAALVLALGGRMVNLVEAEAEVAAGAAV